MDNVPWWLMFAGIAVGAVWHTWWALYAGIAALVLTQGRRRRVSSASWSAALASLYKHHGLPGRSIKLYPYHGPDAVGHRYCQRFQPAGRCAKSLVVFLVVFLFGHALNFALSLLDPVCIRRGCSSWSSSENSTETAAKCSARWRLILNM